MFLSKTILSWKCMKIYYLKYLFRFFFKEKLDRPVQEEENYRKRRKRVLFTETQIDILKSVFARHTYLSAENQRKLAESLNLSPKQVKTWFQNYRYKCRRRRHGYGYQQHEDLEILKSHLGTATTMATPVWRCMFRPFPYQYNQLGFIVCENNNGLL
jgi:hypothetical protein